MYMIINQCKKDIQISVKDFLNYTYIQREIGNSNVHNRNLI